MTTGGKIISGKTHQVYDIEVKYGKETYDIRCPVCSSLREKNSKVACLNVSIPLRTARCNHCGEGFKFVFDYEFQAGKASDYLQLSSDFKDVDGKLLEYITKVRKISPDTLVKCMVKQRYRKIKDKETGNYYQVLCLAFPYYDGSVLRMIKYRDPKKNFSIEKGSKLIFYGLEWIRGQKECIIVEGEFDRLAYIEAGITNVVSVPNGVTISVEEREIYEKTGVMEITSQVNLGYLDHAMDIFETVEKFYIATDDDAAGLKLQMELIRRLGKDKCAIVSYKQYLVPNEVKACKDANDVLIHYGAEAVRETIKNAKEFPLQDVVSVRQVEAEIIQQYQHGLKKGRSTGYPVLDAHFTMRDGHFIVLNGYPGMGKTSFALNLAMLSTLMYDWKWGIYCPENYPVSDAYRMLIELYVGESFDKTNKTHMNMHQMNKAIDFIDNHIYFVNQESYIKSYSPRELREIAAKMIKKYGINGFISDPWNSLDHDMRGDNIDNYLQRELSDEQKFAANHRIIKVVNVHPPTPIRQKENSYRPPTMFEITGGAIWAKKAYEMVCVHIPPKVDNNDTSTEIHVQKVKSHKLVGIPTPSEKPIILQYVRKNGRYIQEDGFDPYAHLNDKSQNEISFEEF